MDNAADKVAVILGADPHVGSTLGLCTPVVKLSEGEYRASPSQRQMFNLWWKTWEEIEKAVSGWRSVFINCGDAVDVDMKDRTHQHFTKSTATILEAAVDVFEPALILAEKIYFVKGTDAHVGVNAEHEDSLANDIDTAVLSESGAWWQACIKAGGVTFDIAHHTNMGALPWTERGAANSLAARTIARYYERGQTPPKLVVRAHVHRHADSYDNYPATRAIILPGWQLRPAYGYKLDPNRPVELGIVVVFCQGGEYEVRKWIYRPEQDQRGWYSSI